MRVLLSTFLAVLLTGTACDAPAAAAPPRAAGKKPLTLETVSGLMPLVGKGLEEPSWRSPRFLTFLRRASEGPDAGSSLFEFDVETSKTSLLLDPPFTPAKKAVSLAGYQWNPSGTALLFSSEADLWLYDIRTRELKRLTNDTAEEENPSLSPDSSMAAYTKKNDLFVLELATGREIRLTDSGGEHVLNGRLDWVYEEELARRRGNRAYEWAPDSRAIAYLRLDEREVPDFPIVDFAPVNGRLVKQKYPKAGDRNATPSVHIVELDSRGERSLSWPSEDVLVGPDFSWTTDGRSVAFVKLDRTQTTLEVWLLPKRGGEPKRLLEEKDPAWINAHEPPVFLPDGGFLFLSERSGFLHLNRHDQGGAFVNAVTEGAWMIDNDFTVDSKAGVVTFIGTEKDPRERHVYRVRLDGSGLRRLSAERGVHGISLSPGGRHYLDTFSNTETPPRSAVHAADGKLLAIVHETSNKLGDYETGNVEFATLAGKDGTLFYTRLVKPAGFDPSRKYPVIVSVYGGPHAQMVQDKWSANTLFDHFLASRGFLVWSLDNRGSWGRGKAFETPVLKRLGEVELADQLEGIAHLRKQPWVDSTRIGIWGWSYGGTMALLAATKTKGAFKAAVSGAPVTDWHLYDSIYTERYMKLPAENPEGYRDASLIERARDLNAKLLILHGTNDDNVHIQNSMRFVDVLIKARKDFEFVPLPGVKHSPRAPGVRVYVFQRILDFFERNL